MTEYRRLEPANGHIVTGVVTVSTGGTDDIATGFGQVTGVAIAMKAAAVTTGIVSYNETLPLSGGTVTFLGTSGTIFSYIITGY